jgi:hypothetical protein
MISLPDNDLLLDTLQAAVPLHILRLQEKGGLDESDLARLPLISEGLAYRGDVLLCGGGKKGEAAELFNGLAFAVAVLSFMPGGVALFGKHWVSNRLCPATIMTRYVGRSMPPCQ